MGNRARKGARNVGSGTGTVEGEHGTWTGTRGWRIGNTGPGKRGRKKGDGDHGAGDGGMGTWDVDGDQGTEEMERGIAEQGTEKGDTGT